MRILKSIYEKANTRVKLQGFSYSDNINIHEGVLQGEVLSPLLFALFVTDIEKLLKDLPGGIQIDGKTKIHILLYADDMVLLGKDRWSLQRKLDALQTYFNNLKLSVNLDKTKVMVFKKGGRRSNKDNFHFADGIIEVVSSYTNLGVTFSSSGKFRLASNHFKGRALRMIGCVGNLIIRNKISSWDNKLELFHAIAESSQLYASHIWAFSHLQ